MNVCDIVLIIILAVFGIEGYRKGFFRETLNVLGIVIVLYISFLLMNPLGNFLLEKLPIVSFSLIGVEIQSLSVLFYQLISFVILSVVLYIILNIILKITGLLSKVMGLNKILVFPFKLLGGVVGLVTGYIVLFFILLVLSVPFNAKIASYRDSKIKDIIIDNKIMMTKSIKKVSNSIDEVYDLTYRIDDDKNRLQNSDIYNAEVMDIMLKNRIVNISTIDKLIKEKKIKTYDKLNVVLDKYR
ncbi:MAG: CvpA family protein [Bacilli bacterium]|nr:CvpA family protein [Bacilli bacterium]